MSAKPKLGICKTALQEATPARSLRPLAAPAANDGEDLLPLPEELIIAPWGDFKALDGTPLKVGAKTAQVLAANQKSQGYEEIALDFSHNSHSTRKDKDGNPLPPEEPLKVAAYGKLSVEEGKGIVFTPTSWTKEGADHYRGRHYKDLSPSILFDEEGEVIFVHSVALTRNGQVEGLHAYSAPEIQDGKTQDTKTLNTNTMENDKYRKLLLQLLKMNDDASDEEIVAAMESLSAEGSDREANLSAGNTELSDALKSLSARLDASEKRELINRASMDGKVIPLSADAIKATPIGTLQELVEKLPSGAVPLSAKTPKDGVKGEGQREVQLSAEQKSICKQLGVAEEDYKKHLEAETA